MFGSILSPEDTADLNKLKTDAEKLQKQVAARIIQLKKTLPEHVADLTASLQGFVDSFGSLATELGQTAQALK